MGDLVVGSVAGAGVSELLKVVIEEAKRVTAFKSEYKELESKMEDVRPITEMIERVRGAEEERKRLNDTISEALVLVGKCSQVKWWNLPSKAKYTRKIEEINKKMLKFCQVQLQLMIYRNQLQNMRPPVALPSYTQQMSSAVSVGVDVFAEAVISKILEGLIEEAKRVAAFKSVYKELASTLEDVLPIIRAIERLQGDKELKKFKDIIDETLELVQKCSKVKRWNLPSKAIYARRIQEINKRMLDFCQIQLQLIIVQKQLLSRGPMGYCDAKPSPYVYRGPMGYCDAKPSPSVYRGPCSVPKLDQFVVGLDLPLREVKKKLLADDDVDQVAILVVSAPPGCGKTTLVTQLCQDDEIKEEFEYIFFCDVSRAPTFRTVVQTLLQHKRYEAPTFENDYKAVDALRNLLEELTGPTLLVLDDVCQGAESFLQKFQINIQDLKILVTSRFEFPSFGPTYHLNPLGEEDAKSLLIERASTSHERGNLLQKILKHCYGFPLLIEVIGVQLVLKTPSAWESDEDEKWESDEEESWFEEETILDSPQNTVLECLQPILNVLDPHLKDCFLDMGSFLKEGKIRASIILDTWMELYGKGSESSTVYVNHLNKLAFHNLLKLVPLGKYDHENSNDSFSLVSNNLLLPIPPSRNNIFYKDFFVTQHCILSDLAICQSKSEEHHERKRLNLEIREDTFPDWCLDLKQPINARLLSISTDDLFSSTWVNLDCPNVEALFLNLSSSSYALPNFIATMKKLKVLIIINHGRGPTKLTNLSCLSSLPSLKRIRFEKISVTWLDVLLSRLGSLEKLSLFRCSFGEVFYSKEDIVVPEALPSLQEIDIDYCCDLDELPDWVYEVVSLKKLSITNCSKLSVLPKALGNLSNLEVLRLCSCFNLHELPETTGELRDLLCLDISGCLALTKLPSEIGKLRKLEIILMRMCAVCELPDSVRNLENLKLMCD